MQRISPSFAAIEVSMPFEPRNIHLNLKSPALLNSTVTLLYESNFSKSHAVHCQIDPCLFRFADQRSV